MKRTLIIPFVALALSTSCAGTKKTTNEPQTVTSAETQPEAVPPEQLAWADMNHDQRKDYMKTVVYPKMKELFSGYDAEFKDMTCGTCHGAGAKDGTFKMPNPKLPKLPSDPAAFQQVVNDHPAMADFMMKTVKPTMAELLGMPEWNPDTQPDGFSCHNCHTAE